jgi:hypothetical protein
MSGIDDWSEHFPMKVWKSSPETKLKRFNKEWQRAIRVCVKAVMLPDPLFTLNQSNTTSSHVRRKLARSKKP